jgi:tight adherence protein C
MVLIALLALALGGIAVAALVRAFTLSRSRVVAHLDELGAYGYAAVAAGAAGAVADVAEARDPALSRMAGRLGDLVARRIGAMREAELRRLLVAAGLYSMSTRSLLGYRVLGAAILAALGILIGHALIVHVALVAFLGTCGWTLPLTYVRRRAVGRARVIERDVPNLIDQVVVTLEAGVGFSSSLQLAADRLTGPLGQEMRLALQEQRMGLSLTESLDHMRERVDSGNLKSFVRAVTQGERLGVSIGHVMRDLAIDMRKRRRQMAEEQAQKTPVKLLLPLVFLVLPTMFIVVLVPPVLELVHGFSS